MKRIMRVILPCQLPRLSEINRKSNGMTKMKHKPRAVVLTSKCHCSEES